MRIECDLVLQKTPKMIASKVSSYALFSIFWFISSPAIAKNQQYPDVNSSKFLQIEELLKQTASTLSDNFKIWSSDLSNPASHLLQSNLFNCSFIDSYNLENVIPNDEALTSNKNYFLSKQHSSVIYPVSLVSVFGKHLNFSGYSHFSVFPVSRFLKQN